MDSKSTPKTTSVKELREKYAVSKPTFAKWLKSVPGLITGEKRINILTPAQVRLIFEHLGEP